MSKEKRISQRVASKVQRMAPYTKMDTKALFSLRDALVEAKTAENRAGILAKGAALSPYYTGSAEIAKKIKSLEPLERALCDALVCCGQVEVFDHLFTAPKVLTHLRELEEFYGPAGGIVGYHCLALELIEKKNGALDAPDLLQPQGYDIRSEKVREKSLDFGIDALEQLAFLCPIGGAGDRFGLKHPKTNEPWPLARLEFIGRSLLERLVLDIVALEELFFKKRGRRIEIPIGLMISEEKNNEAHVREILRESRHFGRSKTSFFLFKQPLVPVFNKLGKWICGDEGLHFKPGGHGMIWRAADIAGFFDYLDDLEKNFLLVRQINNPVAGVDDGLLAFLGTGVGHKKGFGFASCPRRVGAKEGMNVVRREDLTYTLTNIEYTDFARYGLQDEPNAPGSDMSVFPSNTNILFAEKKTLRKGLHNLPFPGPVLNFKGGDTARVELMMQNIADTLGETYRHSLREDQLAQLSTFLTYSSRLRTISVTKEQWSPDREKIDDTPVGALFDWLCLMQELLTSCGIKTPDLDKKLFESKVPFLFDYRPTLGPLFSQIIEKVRGGEIAQSSALLLDIADADISNISVSGICRVEAPEGYCRLSNVRISNGAYLPDDPGAVTLGQIPEGLRIIIEPGGSFEAEDVVIEGIREIRVLCGEQIKYKN